MAEDEEELKSLLMKVKKESEKAGLKFNFQKMKNMASSPIFLRIFHRVLKSRDIALLTKVCLVKAMVFPVVMNGCECWTIKKAEC